MNLYTITKVVVSLFAIALSLDLLADYLVGLALHRAFEYFKFVSMSFAIALAIIFHDGSDYEPPPLGESFLVYIKSKQNDSILPIPMDDYA